MKRTLPFFAVTAAAAAILVLSSCGSDNTDSGGMNSGSSGGMHSAGSQATSAKP